MASEVAAAPVADGNRRRWASVLLYTRRDALFVVLLALGAALRVLVWRAYTPALLFNDSHTYLSLAQHLRFGYYQPSGYPAFIWPLVRLHHPTVVPLVQHVMGLGIAVLLYVVLRRLGAPRWAAALATIPVLFDPLQLTIEQYVMSDVLFEALLAAAIALLLWRRPVGVVRPAAAGLCLAAAGVTRNAGALVVVVAVVAVITLGGRWRGALAITAAFAVPVLGYVVGNGTATGHYAISDAGSRYLYGRLTPIIDCDRLTLSAVERQLCPVEPLHHRKAIAAYVWSFKHSPQYHFQPPPGESRLHVVSKFDRAVIMQQPLDYARMVARDFVLGFQPFRVHGPDTGEFIFVFHREYPANAAQRRPQMLHDLGGKPGSQVHVDAAAAGFLIHYQDLFHTPGPLMGAGFVVSLLALAGVRRARRSGLRSAVLLFAGTTAVTMLTSAMTSEFSWRYQLPQLVLLPPGIVLASLALLRAPAATEAESDAELEEAPVTTAASS